MKLKNNFEGVGLYIHFPFCVKKCSYCDFTSFVLDRSEEKNYFDYLKKEVELFLNKFPSNTKFRVETLYIGGGTPSLITPQYFEDFLKFLKIWFDFIPLKEFTLEANPESITKEKFIFFKSLGVNRVSIGAQSFNDQTLKILGRVHNASDIVKKFYLLRDLGFSNINLDLIFDLPNETYEIQMESLKRAIYLNPEHISYYALMLERGTYLNKTRSMYNFVDEETWLKEYFDGVKLLSDANYIHYEISNFAKDGFFSSHNIKYWKSFPYIGFGVSAGGFISNVRYVNVKNLKTYYEKIDKGILPYSFKMHLKDKLLKKEFMFMGLRLTSGILLEDYYKRFGSFLEVDFKDELEKLTKLKLIKISNKKLTLTKKGLRLSNVVFREFI